MTSNLSTDNKIRCLMCENESVLIPEKLFEHICDHIGYKRYRCRIFHFSTAYLSKIMAHGDAEDHDVDVHGFRVRYLDRVSELIYKDCFHAKKHGIDSVFKIITRNGGGKNETIETNSTNRVISESKMSEKVPISKSIQLIANSEQNNVSNDSSTNTVEVQKGAKLIETVDIRRIAESASNTINVPNSANAFENQYTDLLWVEKTTPPEENSSIPPRNPSIFSDPGQKLPGFPAEKDEEKCRQCERSVNSLLSAKKQHVAFRHFFRKSVKDIDETDSMWMKTLNACFPGISGSGCVECGRNYTSERGRKVHVVRDHYFMPSVRCPLPQCTYQDYLSGVEWHIRNSHKFDITPDVRNRWSRLKKHYKSELISKTSEYFPCPLPKKNPVGLVNIKNSRNDDLSAKQTTSLSENKTTDSSSPTIIDANTPIDDTDCVEIVGEKLRKRRTTSSTAKSGQFSPCSKRKSVLLPLPSCDSLSSGVQIMSMLGELSCHTANTSVPFSYGRDHQRTERHV